MAEENAQVVGLASGVRTPDGGEELLVRDDASGVAGEDAEQGILGSGEGDMRSPHRNMPFGEVNTKRPGLKDRFIEGLGAAKEDAEAGEEFAAIEGLRHVVIRAQVEALDLILAAVEDGEDEDGGVTPLAEAGKDEEAVDVRKSEVEDNRVGRAGGGLNEALLAGRGGGDMIALGLQQEPHEALDLGFVVDDEDAAHG